MLNLTEVAYLWVHDGLHKNTVFVVSFPHAYETALKLLQLVPFIFVKCSERADVACRHEYDVVVSHGSTVGKCHVDLFAKAKQQVFCHL